MATSEKALVERIMRTLNRTSKCTAVKLPGSRWRRGVPDIIGCYQGRFFAIEAKVGKNQLSRLQALTLDDMFEAGATVAVAREEFDPETFLLKVEKNHGDR